MSHIEPYSDSVDTFDADIALGRFYCVPNYPKINLILTNEINKLPESFDRELN